MKLKTGIFALTAFALTSVGFLGSLKWAKQPTEVPRPVIVTSFEPESYPLAIGRNTTIFTELSKLNVPVPEIYEIVDVAKPHLDLSRIRPGMKYQIFSRPGPEPTLNGISFKLSPSEVLELKKEEKWSSRLITAEIQIKLATFSNTVKSSLWESAEEVQMDPSLISELSEIFAWQVDFAREVRENDRWRLAVEQKIVNGKAIGWGRIIAAEYQSSEQTYTGVLFNLNGRDLGYFAPDGSSLRRMFLKSPIQFGYISSRFQRRRFHPILKTGLPHMGVDYAAPTGTPVRVVADGRVDFLGVSGGGGKIIKIRHNSVYQTAYKHLSRFAKISPGSTVRQGQIIGYVGSTGMSTGPHLHFEFYKNGSFVDPLGKKFPNASPVPSEYLPSFQATAGTALQTLPPWPQNT